MISLIHTKASYAVDLLQLRDVSILPKARARNWWNKTLNTDVHALNPRTPLNGDGDQSFLLSP